MKIVIQNTPYYKPALLSVALSIALLSGCSSNSDSDSDLGSDSNSSLTNADDVEIAIVATVASDYTSGAHAVIGTTEPFTVDENLAPTISDITVNAYEDNFYRIERFGADSVTRFSASDPATPVSQFSTMDEGEEGSSNPYGLVFESDSKAYLLRYGKTTAWIVNPLATSAAEFKVGEIDLSDYDPGDGSVEMASGIIEDDKLFIVMQRLDANYSAQDAYVAVIDTNTDTEIDTGTNALNKGILLPVKNPGGIQADDNDEIYIHASGNPYATVPEYTGGIVTLDSDDYSVTMLIDDGDENEHPYNSITNVEIVSPEKGYLVSYSGYQDTALYAFNPVTGVVDTTPVDGLSGIGLSGLATDDQDRLWVSIAANASRAAGIRVYNTDDNTIVSDEIALELNPAAIVFAEQ